MKTNTLFLKTALFFLTVSIYAQENVREELSEIAIVDEKVMMPMRDGARLSTSQTQPDPFRSSLEGVVKLPDLRCRGISRTPSLWMRLMRGTK